MGSLSFRSLQLRHRYLKIAITGIVLGVHQPLSYVPDAQKASKQVESQVLDPEAERGPVIFSRLLS